MKFNLEKKTHSTYTVKIYNNHIREVKQMMIFMLSRIKKLNKVDLAKKPNVANFELLRV
jgi:hypothetical protein